MNRKQFLITMITIIVASVALIVTNAILEYIQWIWVFVISMLGYMYLRYKLSTPLQTFSNKFNMLVDYDLDVETAEQLAKEGMNNAPTKNIQQLYAMYYGMAQYYNGKYEDAIKTFHLLELKRMNVVYHILVFAFSAYAAFELEDQDEFNLSLERINNLQSRITGRYKGFVASYIEILESMKNIDISLDTYRDMVEKHFGNPDGYISTKLTYHYRMAIYYKKINDVLEMDKNLAFVIANGQNHHTALRAREMFKNSVNVEDYVIKEETPTVDEPRQDVFDAEIREIEEKEPEAIEDKEKEE